MEEIVSRSDPERESCGLLAGHRVDETLYIVEDYVFVKNVSEDPGEFIMDPLETIRAVREIEGRGMEVVGLFHTHLGTPPIPSTRDLEGMDAWPVPWLIIERRSGEARAWVRRDGRLDMMDIELV